MFNLDKKLPRVLLFMTALVISILICIRAENSYRYKYGRESISTEKILEIIVTYPVLGDVFFFPGINNIESFNIAIALAWLINLIIAVCAVFIKKKGLFWVLYGVYVILLFINTAVSLFFISLGNVIGFSLGIA